MDKDSFDIFKKYSDKPSTKNSAAVSVVDSYDHREVSREINDFNIELRKQKITCDKFDNSKEDMLENVDHLLNLISLLFNSKLTNSIILKRNCLSMFFKIKKMRKPIVN